MQKQKFIHISFDPVEKFEPKIPQNRAPEEDQTIRRICCIRTGKDMKKDIMKALNSFTLTDNIIKVINYEKMSKLYDFDII